MNTAGNPVSFVCLPIVIFFLNSSQEARLSRNQTEKTKPNLGIYHSDKRLFYNLISQWRFPRSTASGATVKFWKVLKPPLS